MHRWIDIKHSARTADSIDEGLCLIIYHTQDIGSGRDQHTGLVWPQEMSFWDMSHMFTM